MPEIRRKKRPTALVARWLNFEALDIIHVLVFREWPVQGGKLYFTPQIDHNLRRQLHKFSFSWPPHTDGALAIACLFDSVVEWQIYPEEGKTIRDRGKKAEKSERSADVFNFQYFRLFSFSFRSDREPGVSRRISENTSRLGCFEAEPTWLNRGSPKSESHESASSCCILSEN